MRRRARRVRRRRRRRRVLLVGGLVAYGVHKMSTKDAERIQQHTGMDPEEMTDEEIARAMNDLGIEEQRVTESDREQGAASASPGSTDGGSSDLDQLTKLAELHRAGILTDEEFAAKKAQILGL